MKKKKNTELRYSDLIRALPITNEQHAEISEGYYDGFDLDSPEPSGNRSKLYLHGFQNGREDIHMRKTRTMMEKYFSLRSILLEEGHLLDAYFQLQNQ